MRGFTLIELMLSLALIAIITAVALPVSRTFQSRNDLDVAANTVAQTLRRAQTLSQGMDGDTTWGVQVATGSVTLFRGTSYAARDTSFDELTTLPATISSSGLTEIVFSKFSGDPTSTGTFTLTGLENEIRTITINTKGTTTY